MNFGRIVAGMGVLIGMYLIIANGNQSTKIIETISSNSINGIKTLQGR